LLDTPASPELKLSNRKTRENVQEPKKAIRSTLLEKRDTGGATKSVRCAYGWRKKERKWNTGLQNVLDGPESRDPV